MWLEFFFLKKLKPINKILHQVPDYFAGVWRAYAGIDKNDTLNSYIVLLM